MSRGLNRGPGRYTREPRRPSKPSKGRRQIARPSYATLRRLAIPTAVSLLLTLTMSVAAVAEPAVIDARLAPLMKGAADEEVRVIVVLKESSNQSDRRGVDRAARITELKSHAVTARRELAPLLSELSHEGVVRRVRPHWLVPAVSLDVKVGAIDRLAAYFQVERIILDRPQRVVGPTVGHESAGLPLVSADDQDLLSTPVAWGVDFIGAPSVWDELGISGEGVLLALLDTGVDYTHPDLAGSIWRNAGEVAGNGLDDDGNGYVDDWRGYDFSLGTDDPMDDMGHGTHTAGTVCGDGTGGTATGVAPGVTLMPLKVLASGYGYESDSWEAIEYAIAEGAQIVSMSMGWIHCFHHPTRELWRQVAENAEAAGVLIVAAAGNEGDDLGMPWYCPPPDNIRTPADVPTVLAVAATNNLDEIASFSSIGPSSWSGVPGYDDYPDPPGLPKPDLAAPGVGINSTKLGGGYSGPTWDGTSMACPHVAGTAALVLAANPDLTPAEVRGMLTESAVDIWDAGFDPYAGNGRIDALQAVLLAVGSQGSTPLPLDPVVISLPDDDAFLPPSPNPANPEVTLAFQLADTAPVTLAVYDVSGRAVAHLLRETVPAGSHARTWNGLADDGRQLPSGVYWARLTVDSRSFVQKIILAR